MDKSKIAELEARLEVVTVEVAKITGALAREKAKRETLQTEIDWSDPKWIGRLVEVGTNGDDWQLAVFGVKTSQGFVTGRGLATVRWNQCRPYTGPTRPNWIETPNGLDKCPVVHDDWVIVQGRDGILVIARAGYLARWKHRGLGVDIMRYSVVQS